MHFLREFTSQNLLNANAIEEKLNNYDPDIAFMCPGNVKSAVWNKFRVIFYKGEKQHFVICYECFLILSFKSRAGTSGLLRHRCNFQRAGYVMKNNDEHFKAMLLRDITPSTSRDGLFYMPVDVNDIKEEFNDSMTDEYYENNPQSDDSYDGENSHLASMLDVDFSTGDSPEPPAVELSKSGNLDGVLKQPNSLEIKFNQVGSLIKLAQHPVNSDILVKEELEFKINSSDTDVTYRKHNNSVGTWARYMPIYYKNVKQNYVRCLECGWLVLHKTSTGTGSLLRHKCKLKNSSNSDIVKVPNVPSKPATNTPKHYMKMSSVMHQSVIEDVTKQQAKFLFKDIRSADIFDDDHFKAFAQSLINIGCYYGQQDAGFIADKDKLLNKVLPSMYLEIKSELNQALQATDLCYSYNIWHNNMEDKDYLTVNSYAITSDHQYRKLNLKTVPWDKELKLNVEFPQILNAHLGVVTNAPYVIVSHSVDETIATNENFENIPCIVGIIWNIMKKMMEMFNYDVDSYLEKHFENPANEITLDYMEKFLGPFKEPIKGLISNTNTTINEVVLWKKKLERAFKIKAEIDDDNMKTIKGSFLAQIQTELKLHDYHKIAVFFDPKFKGLKFLTDDERTEVLKIVKKHLKSNENSFKDLKKQYASNLKYELNEDDKFVEFMDASIEVADEDLADTEIRQYMDVKLETPVNILEYWRNEASFPLLKSLSKKILSIPASSDEMKIKFEMKGREFKKRCSILNENELDMILYLNQNTAQ